MNLTVWHPDLRLPDPKNVRNKYLFFQPHNLWYFAMAAEVIHLILPYLLYTVYFRKCKLGSSDYSTKSYIKHYYNSNIEINPMG